MSQQTRAIFLFLTIVAVMLVSAVGTTSVYADDGTPPPSPTEAVEVDPSSGGETEPAPTEPAVEPPAGEGEPVATEAPVTEPVATEPPVTEPVATEPPVTEPPAEPAPTEAPAVEEQQPAVTEEITILEQVPDDTTVTVLNAEGETQPLTTQESVDAILTGDPIWCPVVNGIPTPPGGAGCTQEFPSFTELLTFLEANQNELDYRQAGTIYVEMGTYQGNESSIDFNTYNFDTFKTYDLTVQGGWNTADNTTSATTNFNVPITIGSNTNLWIGSLTINNISISNVYNQTGLTLHSDEHVTLNNVEITKSLNGADLNATYDVSIENSKFLNNKKGGAKIKAGGLVQIINSSFNNNGSYGVEIDNEDEVFLDLVSASDNKGFGADIASTGFVAVRNSVFSGNVSYSGGCSHIAKGGYGLQIVTSDGANLKNVTAEKNYFFGAHVEAVKVDVLNSVFNKNLKGYGIEVLGTGNVKFDNVQANENYLFGAHVGAINAKILNSSFNMNGSGSLSNPTGYGLEVLSTGTEVTLENVHADKNQLFGANITAGDGAVVTIKKSFFDGNKSYYKSCNGGKNAQGSDLNKAPTCSGNDYNCKVTYHGYGLQVVTTGTVLLDTVSASENYVFGALLKGSYVSISGGTFNTNGTSDSKATEVGKGLEIISTGGSSLANVTTNNNQFFGTKIQDTGFVVISNGFFTGNRSGLEVVTDSGILLTGVEAKNNDLFGAHLDGNGVQISGFPQEDGSSLPSLFTNNKDGLQIESEGVVLLNAVTANDNKVSGATITAKGNVSINNSYFSGNFSYSSSCKGKTYSGYGLNVVSDNVVSLNNVTANKNYLYGAYVKGLQVFIFGTTKVEEDGTITYTTSFSNNGTSNRSDHIGQGLEVVSAGDVTLSTIAANGNQLFGAKVDAGGYVSVTNSTFNGNYSYYKSCSSWKNSQSGDLNKAPTCSGGQQCATIYDGYGIQVFTTGNIHMGDVTANKNYLFGAKLEGADVEIFNSTFSFNASPTETGKTPTGRGLEVKSTGDTLLEGVEASDNQLFGATIDAGGQVEITASIFSRNKYVISSSCKGNKTAGYGLKVIALNPDPELLITSLDGVEAIGNGAEGAILQSSSVSVENSQFENNGASGLSIIASGPVTLKSLQANGNKVNGVDVKGVCTNSVTVTGGEFVGNSKYGIKIVDAAYTLEDSPAFSNNGSGNVFQSGCITTPDTDDTDSSDSSNSDQGQWNWYWYWYSHSWHGHHHH